MFSTVASTTEILESLFTYQKQNKMMQFLFFWVKGRKCSKKFTILLLVYA